MSENTRREWGAIRRQMAWATITVLAGLTWTVAAVGAPVGLAQVQASGAAPLRAVALAGGSGLLLGSPGHGPGTALSWWFPVESAHGANMEGHLYPLADDAREWGVAVDEARGIALVHWLGDSRELGWREIDADGVPGASGTLDLEGERGRDRLVGVRVAALGGDWLIASPAGRPRGGGVEAFEVSRLAPESVAPLVVEGRLVDFVGRASQAWVLRWDEASGALELGVLGASLQPMQPALVERWTRLDTLMELGDQGVIINPIDEPILRAAGARSVIAPIDRPIDFGAASHAIANSIWEPAGLRSGGPRLALLPVSGAWQGLAAWRRDDGAGRLALFDTESEAHVQALPGVSGDARLLQIASEGEWLAWQGLDATAPGPLLLADLGEAGLENVTELDAGLLLAAWEVEGLVHALTAESEAGGSDAPALGAFPIKPPNEPPGQAGRMRLGALPSKPIIPIGVEALLPGLDGEWRLVVHRFSQKPILPIEFE